LSADHHIRNPFEMAVEQVSGAARDIDHAMGRRPRAHAESALPAIRRIQLKDLRDALREGAADLTATRGDVVFAALVYPIAGFLLAALVLRNDLLPLVFPLLSGFALLGPILAIGLYEISRRREQGAAVTWADALGVLRAPGLAAIVEMGLILLGIFLLWLAFAYSIFQFTLGPKPPASLAGFAHDVFATSAGWTMIVVGVGVGFLFAAVTFAISAISLPAILDRDLRVDQAIGLSMRAIGTNLRTMTLWGVIVAGALILGSLPALFGLIFVVPVLGHATWRLYRKLTAP